MICLRCGTCCKESITTIVLSIERGWVEDNLVTFDGRHGLGKIVCPHLKGPVPGKYYCACHKYDWYHKYSPCARYNEKRFPGDTICEDGKEYMETLQEIANRGAFFMKRSFPIDFDIF